jgi:DNA-binding response OmpR family regulator
LAPVHAILLVEGRKPAAAQQGPVLNDRGFSVTTARTRREAWAKAQESRPSVIVLDSPSLRFSCTRFCEALRKENVGIPVLMLLPEGQKADRSLGARAYLSYPFSTRRLVNKIVRLLPSPDDEVIQLGDIALNTKKRNVIQGVRETHLTPRQARLLEVFMQHPGEVLTRAYLMKRVWDTDYVEDTRTLDVHVHWVRKAIEEDPGAPKRLRTVRGVGYRLAVEGGKQQKKKRRTKS